MAIEIGSTRQALAEIARSWTSSPDEVRPSDLFFPSRHIKALDLNRMLIVGMRGAGKSFWSRALCTPNLRQTIAANYPKLNYGSIRTVYPIRWDNRAADQLPADTSINTALEENLPARTLWLAIFLNALRKEFEDAHIAMGMPTGHDWASKFAWTQSNPELAMSVLWELNRHLENHGQCLLVLTDALDRMTANLNVSHQCVRGLFQLLLELLRTKGVRFKAFIREDMLRTELFNFPDASKLKNDSVTLDWSPEELYALIWKKLGQDSPLFRIHSSDSLGSAWEEQEGIWINSALTVPTQERMEQVLLVFAKKYMGNSAKKGGTYSWWFKHLSDSRGRVSPRTFETSFKHALDHPIESEATHVFMPLYIHAGVREASKDRVAELGDDYQWISLVMATFQDRAVPVNWETVRNSWAAKHVKKEIENKCTQDKIFIPWSSDEKDDRSIFERLKSVLETIGVIKLRDEGKKIDIPDIYRVGFGVGKKGGIRL